MITTDRMRTPSTVAYSRNLLQLSGLVFTIGKTYATPDLEKQLYIP